MRQIVPVNISLFAEKLLAFEADAFQENHVEIVAEQIQKLKAAYHHFQYHGQANTFINRIVESQECINRLGNISKSEVRIALGV